MCYGQINDVEAVTLQYPTAFRFNFLLPIPITLCLTAQRAIYSFLVQVRVWSEQ